MTTPHRYVSGAIDLSEVKARAEAKAQAQAARAKQAAAAQAGGTGGETPGVQLALQLTMDNVEAELIKRSAQVPVIVLIGTQRSPESEQLLSDFTNLALSGAGKWVFRYIDADTDPQVAQMFGIQGLPTTVALASGQPIANFEGGQPADAIEGWIGAIINAVGDQLPGIPAEELSGAGEVAPAEDPRFEPATEALNRGDFEAAIAVYEDILRSEPANKEAKAARDNARLLGRLQELGGDHSAVIATAKDNPGDLDAVEKAADAFIALGQPEEAFDMLIALIAAATDAKLKTNARTRLLELFEIFEPTDARVIAARTKLASALY